MNYQRQAFRPDIDKQIITLVKESCGIRSISRILNISPTTVISRTLKISADLKRPYPIVNGNLISDSKNGVLQTDIGRSSYPYQLKGIHPATSESIQYTYLYDTDDSRIFKRVEKGSALQMEYYLKDIGVYDMTSDKWTYFVQGDDRIARVFPQNYQSPGQNAANTDLKVSQGMANFYEYDHLGNTRIVYSVRDINNGTTSFDVHFAADYYPFGKTLRYFETSTFEEKFLTTQHERDRETGFDYRGARYYDSDLGRFLSLDPLAAKFPEWSAYNYVMGNPVMLIDPDGREPTDDYKLSKDGFLHLIRKTDDKYDRVYATNHHFEVIEDSYVTIYDKSIISQFSNTSREKNGHIYRSAVIGKKGAHSLFKLFKFAADNTNVEWSLIRAKNGDSEEFRLSTSFNGYKVIGSLQFYSEEQIISDIHTHPWTDGHSKEEALYSMGVDPRSDKAKGDWANKIKAGEKSHPKYVYFPNSTAVWKIGYYRSQFSFIRNINNDYKRLFFGGVLYNPNSK